VLADPVRPTLGSCDVTSDGGEQAGRRDNTGSGNRPRATCYHLRLVRPHKAALCTVVSLVTSCGGGNGPTTGPDSAPSEPTVRVTARGFEPPAVVVAVGGRVRFENSDDRPHSIRSNPIDTHADCPSINEVGLLSPGQAKVTGRLPEPRTCNYHDELSETSQLLTGSITIR
jgi:plastocyanin